MTILCSDLEQSPSSRAAFLFKACRGLTMDVLIDLTGRKKTISVARELRTILHHIIFIARSRSRTDLTSFTELLESRIWEPHL
jgi:hypothetical protein